MLAHVSPEVRVVGLFPSADDAAPAVRTLARFGFGRADLNRPDDLAPVVDRVRQRSERAVARLGPIAGPEAAAANFATLFGFVGFVVGAALSAASGAGLAGTLAIGLAGASACWLAGLVRVSFRLSQRGLVAVHTDRVSSVGVPADGIVRRMLAHVVLGWQGARFVRDVAVPHVMAPDVAASR